MPSPVILTRAAGDSSGLAAALRQRGHEVLELPCIATLPLDDHRSLAAALTELGPRDRLVVTSRAGALATTAAVSAIAAPIATVGARAATALRAAGFPVDIEAPTGAALAGTLPIPEGTVLLARSDRALPDLPTLLEQRGAKVREVIAYRTVARVAGDIARAEDLLSRGASLVVSSPSAFDALVERIGTAAVSRARLIATGPTTAQRVRERSGRAVAVAEWDRLAEVLA